MIGEPPVATALVPADAPIAEPDPQAEAPSSAAEAEISDIAPAASPRAAPEPPGATESAAPAAGGEPSPAPFAGTDQAAELRARAIPETKAGDDPQVAEKAPASATSSEPDEQQEIALAPPTLRASRETAPAASPSPEPKPSATPAPAVDRAPERVAAPAQEQNSPDEARPATARAAETIRRALTALFGGAADAPVAKDPGAEPPAPEAAASDQDGSTGQGDLAGIEPGAAPSFDIVRIAPGGAAVIAGRAAPDAEVELKSGDRVVDRVRADRRGEWVAVPQEPLPTGDQELTLLARARDGSSVESDEVLVVAVPGPPSEPAPQATGAPAEGVEVVAAQSPNAALAMALPKGGRGQGRILQAPGRISSDGTLALMVLDYDETGRIRLSGEASPGAPLRIYVDNAPAGAAVVKPSGQWATTLEPSLAPGDYTLRLDQLDPSGKPAARLETPFTRASQPPVEGNVQVDFVIVQPGNSLWRIARRLFGQGVHYVHIYGANQGQIRDPDLIYPGQVFELPSSIGAAG